MLRTLGLRFVIKSIAESRTYRPAHRYSFRMLSTTPRWQAAEVPDDFINAVKHTPLFQKLADKPDALKALSDLYSLTKELGAYFRVHCPVILHGHIRESLTLLLKDWTSILRRHLHNIRCLSS